MSEKPDVKTMLRRTKASKILVSKINAQTKAIQEMVATWPTPGSQGSRQTLALRIELPGIDLNRWDTAMSRYILKSFISESFRRALSEKGLLCDQVAIMDDIKGEFYCAQIDVTDVPKGFAVVKQTLEDLCLLPLCVVGHWDPEARVLYTLHADDATEPLGDISSFFFGLPFVAQAQTTSPKTSESPSGDEPPPTNRF